MLKFVRRLSNMSSVAVRWLSGLETAMMMKLGNPPTSSYFTEGAAAD